MQHSRMDQRIRNPLFEAVVIQKPERRDRKFQDVTDRMHLGIVLEHLIATTDLIHSELPFINTLIKMAAMVPEMSTADLKKVMFRFKTKLIRN